jgi:hypothetical protein
MCFSWDRTGEAANAPAAATSRVRRSRGGLTRRPRGRGGPGLALRLFGKDAHIDIVAPADDQVAIELQNAGIGGGDAMAVGGGVVVDAFDEQPVA